MAIKLYDFVIKGIDVSGYNGTVEWDKVANKGVDFAGIRVGYGKVKDVQFSNNWSNAKGKTIRMPYWYLDYYSNHTSGTAVYGMSDTAWGRAQADMCWSLIKNDNDGVIVFLDIESASTSIAPRIDQVTSRVQTIARAF